MSSTSSEKQFRAVARLIAHKFTINQNSERKNRQVSLRFQVEGGPHDGELFTFGPQALTDKTKPKVRDAYFAMGWNGKGNPAQLDAHRFRMPVEITVKEEVWTNAKGEASAAMKVQFIDPLVKTNSPTLDSDELADLGDFFTSSNGAPRVEPSDADEDYDPSGADSAAAQ